MQAQMRNPDRRPLPSGWVDHYDTQRRLWYYVDINSTTPKVNFIHPEDQDPPTPPSGGYGYPSMPHPPSPPIQPPQPQYQQSSTPQRRHRMSVGGTPFEQAQSQARVAQPSFAQKLYASSVSSQTAYPTPSSSVDERAPRFGGSPTQASPPGGYFDSSSLYTSPISMVPSPSSSFSGLPSPPVSPPTDLYNSSRRPRGSRPASSNGASGYSFASLPSVSESTSNNDDFRSRALFQAAPPPTPSGPPAFNVSSHARNRSSTSPSNGFPSNSNQNPLPSGVFMKPKEAPTYHTVARPTDSSNGQLTTPALQPNPHHPHHANTLPAPAANGHFTSAGVPVTNSLGLAQMPMADLAPQYTGMSNGHAVTSQMTGTAGGQPMQTPSIPNLPAGAAAPQMAPPSLQSMYQQQQPTPAPTPVSNPLTPPPPPLHFTTMMQAPPPPPPPHFTTSMQPPPPPPIQQQPYPTQSQPYQMQPQQTQQSLQAPQMTQMVPVHDPLTAARLAVEEENKKQQKAALKKAGLAMGKTALKFGAKIAFGSVGVPGAVTDLALNATISGVSAVANAMSDNKPQLGSLPNLNLGPAGSAQHNAMVAQMQTLQLQQQQQQQALMQQLAQQQQFTQQALAQSAGQHQQQALSQQLALQQQQQQALSQQLAQQQAAMLQQQQLLTHQTHQTHKPHHQQSILGNVLGQATHAIVDSVLNDNGSSGGGNYGAGSFGGGNYDGGNSGTFGAGSFGGGTLGGFDSSSMFDPGPDPSVLADAFAIQDSGNF